MKKLFLIIIGLCLCTALYADMNPYIAGCVEAAGGCESCNSTNDAELNAVELVTADPSATTRAYAIKFTVSAGGWCVTGVGFKGNDSSGSGSATGEIWTDNEGKPSGTIVGAGFTGTITDASMGNSISVDTEILFSSTQTLSAGTYWAIIIPDFNIEIAYQSGASNPETVYDADATAPWSWTSASSRDIWVIGCTP